MKAELTLEVLDVTSSPLCSGLSMSNKYRKSQDIVKPAGEGCGNGRSID